MSGTCVAEGSPTVRLAYSSAQLSPGCLSLLLPDRVGSVPGAGAVRAISWTGASLVRGRWPGIGSVGCTPPSIKEVNPGKGRISCSEPVCATTCPVRALYSPEGRQTYVGKGVRQPHRHTGRLPGKGDPGQESIYVVLLGLF